MSGELARVVQLFKRHSTVEDTMRFEATCAVAGLRPDDATLRKAERDVTSEADVAFTVKALAAFYQASQPELSAEQAEALVYKRCPDLFSYVQPSNEWLVEEAGRRATAQAMVDAYIEARAGSSDPVTIAKFLESDDGRDLYRLRAMGYGLSAQDLLGHVEAEVHHLKGGAVRKAAIFEAHHLLRLAREALT